MGSLMAGWDSPVSDPKAVRYQRNKSFTKGEIDAYWRSQKRIQEEHLKSISVAQEDTKEITENEGGGGGGGGGGGFPRSSSMPLTDRKGNIQYVDAETVMEKLKKDWWTRTNWAFLNEPPVIATEGRYHNYKPQSFQFLKTKRR
ncbi:hypothetical protein Syun_005076 [Stephania yunnanensis]|uniref:Uncharacterized protein n=1 Tax=Stephania yunnanensis TaxID=152371 RepID=A0AAP0L899_9MAGN